MQTTKFFIKKKKIDLKSHNFNLILTNNNEKINLIVKNKIPIIDLNNNNIFIKKNTNIISFLEILKLALRGSERFFFMHLTITGLGFRIRRYVKGNICFLRIELGYSHFIYYPLPETVFFMKGKKKFMLYSPDFNLLKRIVMQLTVLRKVNPYKEKGLLITGKVIKKKSGKQDQR
jgi:ribosomal protein L6P/L9E